MKPVSTLAEEYLNRPPRTQSTEPPPSPFPAPLLTSESVMSRMQVTEPEADTGEVSADVRETEEPTELDGILDDLVAGNVEPTLPRLTEGDVALDMDEVEEEVDVESDESEWETDVDEESGEESGVE